MIRDPFTLYRQPKLKQLLNKILMIVIVVTILWSFLDLVITHGIMNFGAFFGDPTFVSMIIVLVLSWIGYLILNGTFQPPVDAKGLQQRRPSQQLPQQPVQQQPPQQLPATDYCSICKKEFPSNKLRNFTDHEGNVISICEKCFNE